MEPIRSKCLSKGKKIQITHINYYCRPNYLVQLKNHTFYTQKLDKYRIPPPQVIPDGFCLCDSPVSKFFKTNGQAHLSILSPYLFDSFLSSLRPQTTSLPLLFLPCVVDKDHFTYKEQLYLFTIKLSMIVEEKQIISHMLQISLNSFHTLEFCSILNDDYLSRDLIFW